MANRRRSLAVIALVAAALAVAGGLEAGAFPLPGDSTTTTAPTTTEPPTSEVRRTTTTTAAPPATTTTTSAGADGEPDDGAAVPDGPVATQPGADPAPGQPAPPAAGPGSGGGGDAGDGAGVADPAEAAVDPNAPAPQLIPPDALAAMRSVPRSGSRSTARLLELLAPLHDVGLTEAEILRLGMGQFPIGGRATYTHDWWFPRFVPTFHLHEGTDVFAAMGTPVRAPWPGVVRITEGAVGGRSVYVTQPDGTYVYLGHLQDWAEGLADGDRVETGDVVGYVGDTGNARGGKPHVHLEIHPRGGAAIDPKPILDAWLDAAEAAAPGLVGAQRSAARTTRTNPGLRFLAPGHHPAFAAPTTPSRAELLWTAAAAPEGAGVQLAAAAAVEAADRVDWDHRAVTAARRLAWWEAADARARAVLAPLTPPALARVLAGDGRS